MKLRRPPRPRTRAPFGVISDIEITGATLLNCRLVNAHIEGSNLTNCYLDKSYIRDPLKHPNADAAPIPPEAV